MESDDIREQNSYEEVEPGIFAQRITTSTDGDPATTVSDSAREQSSYVEVSPGVWAKRVTTHGGGGGDVTSVNGKTGDVVLDADDVGAVDKNGGDVDGSLELISSYPSDDVSGGTDGTSRLNLQSYQRANFNSFGETIRHFLVRKDAKAMEAYYVPKLGYDSNRNAIADFNPDGSIANIAQWQPISWTGSHFEANDHNSNHVHWELEIPDSTGALQGRLEVPFANPDTGVIGLDKTFIRTNLADLVVRTSNGQMLRLSSPSGNHKPIEFNHDSEGATSFRRWIIRANSTAETGSNAGTDFQIVRYNDSGVLQDSPIFITRATGFIGMGTINTPNRVSLPASTVSSGGIGFGSDTNLYRSAANTLKTDDLMVANGFDASSQSIANVATPTNNADAANKQYVDTGLGSKANDSAVVHLAGNETISGSKTFTSALVSSGSGAGLFQSSAGFQIIPAVRNAAVTLGTTSAMVNLCNATTAAFTVTLPTAAGRPGQAYMFKKTDGSANVVTIATTSSQTIDGATSYALDTQFEHVWVVSDGSNWSILGKDSASVSNPNPGVETHSGSGMISPAANSAQFQLVDASSGAVMFNLPDALDGTAVGKMFTVKKIDNSANGISVDGGEANIDGAASQGLSNQYSYITVVFDGTNYHIVASGGA